MLRPLTRREKEVLNLLLKGKSNQNISIALGISVNTVKGHMSRILLKLNADSRLHLVTIYQSEIAHKTAHRKDRSKVL